jgi:heme exporter protein A
MAGWLGGSSSSTRFFVPEMSADFAGEALTCLRGERLVFQNLSFRARAGEALLLTGPNGSGKSSLLRLMAGLLAPAAGRLIWDGAAVADDRESHRARLHYVGHLDALKPALTVAENLAFYAALRGNPADDATLDRALVQFRLDQLADTPARFLSQGQRRRAALARVIVVPAPLWLLDEPTLALDDASLAALGAVLTDHLAAGGHVIAATHAPIAVAKAQRLELAA